MWRASDEALLVALEAERALVRAGYVEETARRLAPLVPVLSPARPRAPGTPDGDPLVLVEPRVLLRLEAESLHRASVLGARRLGSAADARAAIAGWICLGTRHRDYLLGIARWSAGAAGAAARPALDDAWRFGLDAVERGVRGEAATLSERGAALLAVLDEAGALAALAGADGALAERVTARARRIRLDVVDALVLPIEEGLAELRSTEWTAVEAARWLERAERAWRWAGRDAALAELVVRVLPDLAWPLHQAGRVEELRTILAPAAAPVEDLARRLRADPSDVAFRAAAAQALVFLAETAGTLEEELALAERALSTCPTLRNARVVCADRLVRTAERLIAAPAEPVERAAALARRARELYPALQRLPALEAALAARRAAAGGRP